MHYSYNIPLELILSMWSTLEFDPINEYMKQRYSVQLPSFKMKQQYLSHKFLPIHSMSAYAVSFSSIDEMLSDLVKSKSKFFSLFTAESRFCGGASLKIITMLKDFFRNDVLKHYEIFGEFLEKETLILEKCMEQDLSSLFDLWLNKFRWVFKLPLGIDIRETFLTLEKIVSLWIGEKSLVIYRSEDKNTSIIYNAMFAFDPKYFLRITTHEFLHLLFKEYKRELSNSDVIIEALLNDPLLNLESVVQILTAYAMIKWKKSNMSFEKKFMDTYSASVLSSVLQQDYGG